MTMFTIEAKMVYAMMSEILPIIPMKNGRALSRGWYSGMPINSFYGLLSRLIAFSAVSSSSPLKGFTTNSLGIW